MRRCSPRINHQRYDRDGFHSDLTFCKFLKLDVKDQGLSTLTTHSAWKDSSIALRLVTQVGKFTTSTIYYILLWYTYNCYMD